MKIKKVNINKEQYIDLFYLASENYELAKKAIRKSDMYIITTEDDIVGQICIKRINSKIFEIKNIFILEKYRNKGHGSNLVKFIIKKYKNKASIIVAGCQEIKESLNFYIHLGFKPTTKIKNYFLDNYDSQLYINNTKLCDLIYLKKII